MLQEIKKQIDNIDKSIEWIRENKPEDFKQRFLQLVDDRKELKKIRSAAANNPGIAAFGKSQVGKSYLISCLLQGRDSSGRDLPFEVKAGETSYNFVYKINPPSEEGGGRESTGVVSRFSSFKRDETLYNVNFPVLVKPFTVTDLILILSDSYYNDFNNYTGLGETQMKELCEQWEREYEKAPLVQSAVVCADDILNIKCYFEKHINNAQTRGASLFDRLALLIDKIPVSDYAKVFSSFWNREATITALFSKLISILQTFNFADSLYLPIESVLHEGIRENTIMSVQCLKQLFINSSQYTSDVYVNEGGRFERRATNMPKSEIAAICSEIIFKIDDGFLSSSRPYKWENMAPDVQSEITHGNVEMKMLEDNDLLDFPGARAREQEDLKKLSTDNVLDFFLRGKVAYLFNKYSEEMGINILLYCHHNKDNDVTGLYKLLEDWVMTYVGKNSDERKEKLKITQKSPLFYIGTMFNLDMEKSKGMEIDEMTPKSIDQRWIGRFDTVVNKQCFHRITADWVKNWTDKGVDFNNSYILRDYKFSTNLYDGFEELGQESASKMPEKYFGMMRQTFIENEHVKRLFEKPAVSWDVATTQGNDGALFIIENLTKVASKMNEARESDFKKILDKVRSHVYCTMRDYYQDTDAEAILQANIRKANAIFAELDFTCNFDNYYFGHLIQALQISETASYQAVHKMMQSPDLNNMVNDFKDYEIIRNSCEKKGYPLDKAKSEADKWNCLMKTYAFEGKNEAQQFLARKKVDVEKLFAGPAHRKLNSCIIADAVFGKWCSSIKSVEFLNEFSSEESFDTAMMNNLVDGLISTANSFDVRDRMADSIAEYVNIVAVHTANENLLADILSSTINNFVLDFGFKWLADDEKTKAKALCDKYNIPAFNYIMKELPATFDDAALAAMFNEMISSQKDRDNTLLPSFEDNYNKWKEYMFISFVAHLDVPDIDPEANNSIKTLLDSIKVAA